MYIPDSLSNLLYNDQQKLRLASEREHWCWVIVTERGLCFDQVSHQGSLTLKLWLMTHKTSQASPQQCPSWRPELSPRMHNPGRDHYPIHINLCKCDCYNIMVRHECTHSYMCTYSLVISICSYTHHCLRKYTTRTCVRHTPSPPRCDAEQPGGRVWVIWFIQNCMSCIHLWQLMCCKQECHR